MPSKGGRPDALEWQIAWKLGIPKDATVSKRVFDKLTELLVANRQLPNNVAVSAVWWRNPQRHGSGAYWRTHKGADLSTAPGPIAPGYPRGSLRDAIDTLANALENGNDSVSQVRAH